MGNDINGNPKPYNESGLEKVYSGEAAADYFKVKPGDSRVPDIFGIAQVGVVYTGHKAKIAEHGGANPQDRDVPLVVAGGPVTHHEVDGGNVATTQIAPTILGLLGLDPTPSRPSRSSTPEACRLDKGSLVGSGGRNPPERSSDGRRPPPPASDRSRPRSVPLAGR